MKSIIELAQNSIGMLWYSMLAGMGFTLGVAAILTFAKTHPLIP